MTPTPLFLLLILGSWFSHRELLDFGGEVALSDHHGEVIIVRVFVCLFRVFLVVRGIKVIRVFRRGFRRGYMGLRSRVARGWGRGAGVEQLGKVLLRIAKSAALRVRSRSSTNRAHCVEERRLGAGPGFCLKSRSRLTPRLMGPVCLLSNWCRKPDGLAPEVLLSS